MSQPSFNPTGQVEAPAAPEVKDRACKRKEAMAPLVYDELDSDLSESEEILGEE